VTVEEPVCALLRLSTQTSVERSCHNARAWANWVAEA